MRLVVIFLSLICPNYLFADSWVKDSEFINKLTLLASEKRWSDFDKLMADIEENKNCFHLTTLANAFSGADGNYPRSRESYNKSLKLHILAMQVCDENHAKVFNSYFANDTIRFLPSVDESDSAKNELYEIYRQNPKLYFRSEIYLKLISKDFEVKDLPEPKSRLGITLNDSSSSVVVNEVFSGMAGEKVGFMSKDEIIEINGNAISNYSAFIRVFQTFRPGELMTYKVLRKNKFIVLEGHKPYPSYLEFEKSLVMFALYFIGNYQEAVALIDFENESDLPTDNFITSFAYYHGIGVERNFSKSIKYAEKVIEFFITKTNSFDHATQLNAWGSGMELYYAINWALVLLGEANMGVNYLSKYIEKPDKYLGLSYLNMASYFKPSTRGLYFLSLYNLQEKNYVEAERSYKYLIKNYSYDKYYVGQSQRDLAFLYREIGDEKKYWDYIEQSANNGNIASSAQLGKKFWIENDHKKAKKYLEFAAENSNPKSLAILGNAYMNDESIFGFEPEKGFLYMKRSYELGEDYMEQLINMWGALGNFNFLTDIEKKDYSLKFIDDSENGKIEFSKIKALNYVGFLTYNNNTGFNDKEFACNLFNKSKQEGDIYGYFWSTVCDIKGGSPIGYTTQQLEDIKYLSRLGVSTASLYLSEYYLENPIDRNIGLAKQYYGKASYQKNNDETNDLINEYSDLAARTFFVPSDSEFNRLKALLHEAEMTRIHSERNSEAIQNNNSTANLNKNKYGFWDFVIDALTVAAIVFVAGEVIDALDDVDFGDYRSQSSSSYSNSFSQLNYNEPLSYNEPYSREKRRSDHVTAFLSQSTLSVCNYKWGAKSYTISKGISPCPVNVELPISGVFDTSQMNYSSGGMKTTWLLDMSRSYSASSVCIYKFGNQSRVIPKAPVAICPSSQQF